MFKYTVNYEDFDGNQQSEVLYFNLSKPEMLKLQMKNDGGYAEYLQKIANSNNPAEVLDAFSDIVLMAYGQKSEDGKRFVKSEEAKMAFSQSVAYDTFLFELIENPAIIENFMNGVFPKDLLEKAAASAQ